MPGELEPLVVNTGPLISLGRSGALEIVQKLPFLFLTPSAVAEEIAAGARQGHSIEIPGWIQITQLQNPPSALVEQSLDRGEAAVISLALELKIATVCIDEWRGRRVAKAVGLEVTGSLGLLGRAKTAGLIPQLKPWIERLAGAGARLDIGLIRQFLRSFGEE